jgi:hypothetical protein
LIAKIVKGKGFRGLLEYLCATPEDEVRGRVLAGNLSGNSPRQWAAEFGLFRKLRPTLGKAVFHASISPAHEDRELSDDEYSTLAQEFLIGMGFPADTPFLVIKHEDIGHPHIHIAASRITPRGDVVSDAKDFKRAEALMRGFERKLRLRALQPPPKEQEEAKETAMEQETIPAEAGYDLASEPVAGATAEDWNEDRRREAKRLLLEEEFIERLRQIFQEDELAFIRRNRRKARLQIRFKDGSSLYDEGDRLAIKDKNDVRAARRLVALAAEKGWTSVSLSGNSVFVKEAMRLAMQNGMQVIPKNPEQAAMLEEVLKEGSSMAGGSGQRPVPAPSAPAHNPPPQIDMSRLAALRKSNANRRSGPKVGRR